MTTIDDLLAEAVAIRELGASVIGADDIGSHAIERGVRSWRVFPLLAKTPFASPHPGGSQGREHRECGGRCGHPGHGLLAATTDVEIIARWWGGSFRGCNIGGRVPESMIAIDVDPYHGGEDTVREWVRRYGELPHTLTHYSGRGDGGRHLFFRRPAGKMTSKRLRGTGVDLRTSANYVVLPPSVHPDTGRCYVEAVDPVATPPGWLIQLLKPEKITPLRPRSSFSSGLGGFFHRSIADEFNRTTSWREILTPHGWQCIDADPDADGARWVHPTHTSACSATIRHTCLFVWSTSTVFEASGAGDPNGYTKFRAFSILNHGGDMSAAARTLRQATT